MSLFLCLSGISLRSYCWKSLAKSRGVRKGERDGHRGGLVLLLLIFVYIHNFMVFLLPFCVYVYIYSSWNNVFLIDWLFKWMLGRMHSPIIYSWGSGGAVIHTSSRSKVRPWLGNGGKMPRKFFLLMPTEGN